MDNFFAPHVSDSPDEIRLPPFHTLPHSRLPFPPVPVFSIPESARVGSHLDTLRDVESAFHNAEHALRHAREVLRSDAIMSNYRGLASASNAGNNDGDGTNGNEDGNNNIVDLTTLSSDTSNDDPEVRWSHTRHPNDSRPRGRRTHHPHPASYAVRSIPTVFGAVGHLPHIRPHPQYIYPPYQNHRAEETAIRRQRQARRDWERVERRNAERAAAQAQRDATEQARRVAGQAPSGDEAAYQDPTNTRARRYSSDSSDSSISVLSDDSAGSEDTDPTIHQNTQGTTNSADTTITSMPPTQSIDLTTLDDQPTLKDKILSHQQQSAIAAQNAINSQSKDFRSSQLHATALSTYRCAICMDIPTTATTTICGHLFCHTCLKDSLKWSAQQRRDEAGLHGRRMPNSATGLCPVCRKLLSDKEGGSKPGIVGLEIKAMNRKDWERKKKQERADQEREDFLKSLSQRNTESEKGKEREKDSDDHIKTESQNDEPMLGPSRNTRIGRKRRRDEGGDYENLEGF